MLLLFAVLALQHGVVSAAPGVVADASAEGGDEADGESVPLSSLTDAQVNSALDSMTTATLVQIIESQGYSVEEGTEHSQVLQAAKSLVRQERDRQLAEAGAGAGAGAGAAAGAGSGAGAGAGARAAEVGAFDGSTTTTASSSSKPAASNPASAKMQPGAKIVQSEDAEDETEQTEQRQTQEKEAATVEGWNYNKPIPEDAGFWDLFTAQVASDFGPVWRLVPEPIRAAVAQQSKLMGKPLRQALCGAVGPMLKVASKVMTISGHGLVGLGAKVSALSAHISTLADAPPLKVERSKNAGAAASRHGRSIDDEDEEEDADVIEI